MASTEALGTELCWFFFLIAKEKDDELWQE